MAKQKKVFLFRHFPKLSGPGKNVIKLPIPLTEEGARMAEETAEKFREVFGEVVAISASPAVRTHQTAMIFAEICGEGEILSSVDPELLGCYWEWDRVISMVSSENPTVRDFYDADSEFLIEEGWKLFQAIVKVAGKLKAGENAICVSHGGIIEPAVACSRLSGSVDAKERLNRDLLPEDLPEGGGYCFTFEGDDFKSVELIQLT